MMRRWDRGPLANTADELLNTSDPQRFRQLWREARSPANVRNGDKPWRSMNLSSFSTWSSNAKVPVELLTLQTYAGVRVGVAILFHLNRESSIRELFIWPPYRRKGLGSLLERFAIERATAAGSIRIKAYVSEADSIRGLTRATAFLESREYNVRYIEDDDYIVEANRDIS